MEILGISPEVWFPVVTLVIGFVGKGILDSRADSRTARRDRGARKEAASAAARLRRIEFQRATLLATQDAVLAAMRSATVIHIHDSNNRSAPGGWGSVLADDAISDGHRVDMQTLLRHRVRVRDDETRTLLRDFAAHVTDTIMARSAERGFAALQAAVNGSSALNERIGDLLRTLDDQEDAVTG